MDKKEQIEKVFTDGSNALYYTINPETGNCDDKEKYERLKKESVDNFIALSQPKEVDLQKPVESDAVEFKNWCDNPLRKSLFYKGMDNKELYEQFKQLKK